MLKKLAERFRTLNVSPALGGRRKRVRHPWPIRARRARAPARPRHLPGGMVVELASRCSGLQAGQLPLFDDSRIHWAIEALDGVPQAVLSSGRSKAGIPTRWSGPARVGPRHRGRARRLPQVPRREGARGAPRSRFVLGDLRVLAFRG